MKKLMFALSLLLVSQFASAVTLNYDGTLLNRGDYDTFQFTVSSPSTVNIWTDSFGPGFDPILGLFDMSGNQIAWNDDHGSSFGGANPGLEHVLQDAWDSSLKLTNLVGNYILAISTFSSENWNDHQQGKSLAATFAQNASGSFSKFETGYYNIYVKGANVGPYVDQTSTVPEPGVLPLMLLGLFGFYSITKKKSLHFKKVAI